MIIMADSINAYINGEPVAIKLAEFYEGVCGTAIPFSSFFADELSEPQARYAWEQLGSYHVDNAYSYTEFKPNPTPIPWIFPGSKARDIIEDKQLTESAIYGF